MISGNPADALAVHAPTVGLIDGLRQALSTAEATAYFLESPPELVEAVELDPVLDGLLSPPLVDGELLALASPLLLDVESVEVFAGAADFFAADFLSRESVL